MARGDGAIGFPGNYPSAAADASFYHRCAETVGRASTTAARRLEKAATVAIRHQAEPARSQVPRAAARALGYEFLVAQGVIASADLDAAIVRARRIGIAPHRQLIDGGLLASTAYVAALADALDLAELRAPSAAGFTVKGETALKQASAAEAFRDGTHWIALDGAVSSPRAVAAIARRLRARGYAVGLTTQEALRDCALARHRGPNLRRAVAGLARKDPAASARAGSWAWQSLSLAGCIGLFIGLTAIAGISALWLETALLTLPFLVVVVQRLLVLAAYPFARPRNVAISPPHLDQHLPVYTLLVPLFRETRMLAGLTEALEALDYPGVMAQTPPGNPVVSALPRR